MEILVLLGLTLLVRIFDGIEHGIYWNRDSENTDLHDADLWQTWLVRGLYGFILYLFYPLSFSLVILYAGILMLDQAIWQIFLNKFAGNGWFSGELDEAEFSWWPTSGKTFANRGRIVQILIGLILILAVLV